MLPFPAELGYVYTIAVACFLVHVLKFPPENDFHGGDVLTGEKKHRTKTVRMLLFRRPGNPGQFAVLISLHTEYNIFSH